MSTDLGYRKVSRSAYAHETAQTLDIYLGTCEDHGRPVRHEGSAERSTRKHGMYLIECPGDGGHMILAERLVAVTTTVTCDGSCMGARGPNCDCGCGGANHGKSWGVTATREQFESALARYRAEQERTEARRVQRAEARVRKARQGYDTWAADHAELLAALEAHRPDELGYPQPGSNNFLCDIARQALIHGKILTDGQVAAATRVVAEVTARNARVAAEKAERAASARPCPEGRVEISGEIVKIKASEGFTFDSTRLQAIVAADGYAVMITLPRAVEDWATGNRRTQLWEGYETWGGRGTDYDGLGQRWTKACRGVRITFTAQVERSGRDESFGFGKRPTRVSFTPVTDDCCADCTH